MQKWPYLISNVKVHIFKMYRKRRNIRKLVIWKVFHKQRKLARNWTMMIKDYHIDVHPFSCVKPTQLDINGEISCTIYQWRRIAGINFQSPRWQLSAIVDARSRFYNPLSDRGSYTSGHFIWNLWNEPSASFINFKWNGHECKILFIIWLF